MKSSAFFFLLGMMYLTSCCSLTPGKTTHPFSAVITIKSLVLDVDFYRSESFVGPDSWTIIRKVSSSELKSIEGKHLGAIYLSEGNKGDEIYAILTAGENKIPNDMFVLQATTNTVMVLERHKITTANFHAYNWRIVAAFMKSHLAGFSLPTVTLRTDDGRDLIPQNIEFLKNGDPYVLLIDGHYLWVFVNNYGTQRGYWFTEGKQTNYAFGPYSDLSAIMSQLLMTNTWVLDAP